MDKQQFLTDLEDLLQREEQCYENDELETYEEWDSLSQMSLIAYFDQRFGVKLGLSDFKNIKTVKGLINLSEGKIND